MSLDDDPWKIVALKNPDKELHEKSAANDDPLNLLHPSRVLLAGKPNSGKTAVALAILARKQPPFETGRSQSGIGPGARRSRNDPTSAAQVSALPLYVRRLSSPNLSSGSPLSNTGT